MPIPPIPGRDVLPPGNNSGSTRAVPAPRRPPAGPTRRRLTRAVLALLVVLGVAAAYYVGLYFYVDSSINRVDALVTDGPEVLAPQLQNVAETYLVVGTGLAGRSGPASVSTLIAHVSGDGKRAVLVTVPPTALIDTPTCRTADGSLRQAVTEPFAAALLDGGPSCLVRAVQQLSGLRVDHYLGVDLGSLPDMVDALGRVPVCLTQPVTGGDTGRSNGSAGLTLPAGEQQLSGRQATAYLGRRAGEADVTGTASAAREQLVLTSTLRSALSASTLADPVTLTRFLTRASSAFTVDADTTLGDVRSLGARLGTLSADATQRAGVPVARIGYVPAGSAQATVLLDGAATRALFDAVIDGDRLPTAQAAGPAAAADSAATASTAAAPSGAAADTLPDPTLTDPVPPGSTVTVPPAGVVLDVLDATREDRAPAVAQDLAAVGFRTGAVGTEPAAVNHTLVRYGPASLEPARTVAAAVPGAVLTESDAVGDGVQLVLGADYQAVTPVTVGAPVPTSAAPATAPTAGDPGSCG